MTYSQFYLPANIPQWGIFLGIVFVIVGYIDKKEFWTVAGWIILIATGLTSLAFNLFGGFRHPPEGSFSVPAINALVSAGWQSAIGGALAAVSLFFQRTKRRNYKMLAILTLIYFMLIFFEFNSLTRSSQTKPQEQTEQSK